MPIETPDSVKTVPNPAPVPTGTNIPHAPPPPADLRGAQAPPPVDAPASVTPATPAPVADPLGAQAAERAIAYQRLNDTLSELQESQATLASKYEELAARGVNVTPAQAQSADDVPPEVAADPGYRKLLALEKANAELAKQVGDLTSSLKGNQERETAARQAQHAEQSRVTGKENLNKWLDNKVVPGDPALKENPAIVEALRIYIDDWVTRTFDPFKNIPAQENQFVVDINRYMGRLKAASGGAPSLRATALEVNANAQNNLSAGTANRPPEPAADANPFDKRRDPALWLRWKHAQNAKAAGIEFTPRRGSA